MAFKLPPLKVSVHHSAIYREATKRSEKVLDYLNNPPKPRRLAPLKEIIPERKRALVNRLHVLRQEIPALNPHQTKQFRYSYVHWTILDLLEDGHHYTASRILNLVEKHRAARLRAGPDSVTWTQPLLENQHKKLDALKELLIECERAERLEAFKLVYDGQLALAEYFLETGDLWLSDHFFSQCLDTCLRQEKVDRYENEDTNTTDEENENEEEDDDYHISSRTTAEAYCNMGLVCERNNDLDQASLYFTSFHQYTKGQDWVSSDGAPLYRLACQHMARTHIRISEGLKKVSKLDDCIQNLLKAYDYVSTDNKKYEGEVCYKLGLAYELCDDMEKAVFYLKKAQEIGMLLGDSYSVGLAFESIGRLYARKNKMDIAILYNDQFAKAAEKTGMETECVRASVQLGSVYNIVGQYGKAKECFRNAFDRSLMKNWKNECVTRVFTGICIGHAKVPGFAAHVGGGATSFTKRLIRWKDSRNELLVPVPV